ncbi:MAG: ArsR family transcriptional regulator [Balneolaceae bacterium]|nr:MAG: ArsR family transcriptional regulator [Balneolaceae bacterium]
MKGASQQISSLRYPLNTILGSKGHILIIRELLETGQPMNHSELIDRTNLSRQGVYDVVERLVENGLVTYSGSGRRQLVEVRKNHPLHEVLIQLFKSEKGRFESLTETLRTEINALEHKPESAWIFGKAAQGVDEYGDPLQIALLGKLKSIDSVTNRFRERLIRNKLEPAFDVTIDLRGITVADLEARPSLTKQGMIHLWGVDPVIFLNHQNDQSPAVTSHKDHDEKTLKESKAWTELLKTHPEIIPRTVTWLNRQIEATGSGEKMEWLEWKNLLENCSYQRLKKFMESDSERSVRLRQSLPFWMVLAENERTKFEQLIR